MAKKSNAHATADGKVSKLKTGERSTSTRARKARSPRRTAVKKIKVEVVPAMAAKAFDPTTEQIQMRAYFISERRRRFDLPGDANSDWLEAKRQLLAEVSR